MEHRRLLCDGREPSVGRCGSHGVTLPVLASRGTLAGLLERTAKILDRSSRWAFTGSFIVVLLTTDFTKLVLIANLIAWPVDYYLLSNCLNRFAFKAPFAEWAWLFIASAVAALLAAWLTIALQAGRAATARPVLALRYE